MNAKTARMLRKVGKNSSELKHNWLQLASEKKHKFRQIYEGLRKSGAFKVTRKS